MTLSQIYNLVKGYILTTLNNRTLALLT